MTAAAATVLTRSGHLSELTLDRYSYDPAMDAAERAAIDAHLEACEACRDALHELRAFDAGVSLRPPSAEASPGLTPMPAPAPAPAAAVDLAEARRRRLKRSAAVAAPILLAAAAALALALQPDPAAVAVAEGADVIRLKSAALTFEVHVADEGSAGSRRVVTGDTVRPGDRFGFRVATKTSGWLLVAGVDDSGEPYVCYPQEDEPPAAIAAADEPMALDAAMRFDDRLGEERLVGLFCAERFDAARALETLRDVTTPVRDVRAVGGVPAAGDGLPESCVRRDVVLTKTAPGPRSNADGDADGEEAR